MLPAIKGESKTMKTKPVTPPKGQRQPRKGQFDRLQRLFALMQFQEKMPTNPFMTKDEAYDSVGCGPRSSLYIYANN